jgi:hypothetical protein
MEVSAERRPVHFTVLRTECNFDTAPKNDVEIANFVHRWCVVPRNGRVPLALRERGRQSDTSHVIINVQVVCQPAAQFEAAFGRLGVVTLVYARQLNEGKVDWLVDREARPRLHDCGRAMQAARNCDVHGATRYVLPVARRRLWRSRW